jgi:hypothetical protein
MIKTAMMFPYRLTNDNIANNQIEFLGAEMEYNAAI